MPEILANCRLFCPTAGIPEMTCFLVNVRTALIAVAISCVAGTTLFFGARQSLGFQPETKPKTHEVLLKDFVESCVAITPGIDGFSKKFQMGRHFTGPFTLPERTVEMKQPFRISKFETTQELYAAVTGSNPSRWKGPHNSVESMTYLQAEAFCAKLTAMLHAAKLIPDNEVVRLPTEAEWEYCCRAGTDTAYSFGDKAQADGDQAPVASILDEYAWHTGNAAGNDPAVGVLKPNSWGLFDMHGYLWEFVSDKYEPKNGTDASSTKAGASLRILRGGSWRDHYLSLTSGARMPIPDHTASDAIGFRCVIAAENTSRGHE